MKKISLYAVMLFGTIANAQNLDSLNINNLEDVIVTANKKEENIIKVNTSVSSLNSKKIENSRI